MSLVSYVQLEESNMKKAIEDSLNLINYKFKKNIQNITIKPNMCYYWDYTTGQTTDPRFVAALIDILREQISPDVNISVVEADASAMKCKYAFKLLGYEKMAKKCNVNLVNLSEDTAEKVELSVAGENFDFMLPDVIKNADLRINVPKIKYLLFTKISASLKNIFGANPVPSKYKWHPRLDETIVALNRIMKFDLCILDGIVVLGQKPRKINLVMASEDSVSLDAAASKLLGVNPKSVRHITLASKEGLGNLSYVSKGMDPNFFEKQYPRRTFKDKFLFSAYQFALWSHLLDSNML